MTSNGKLLLIYLASILMLVVCIAKCPIVLAYEHSPAALEHLEKAKRYVDQGKYEQAKTELELGLKSDPKSPDILNNLGGIYLRLSQNFKDSEKRSNNLNTARTYFTSAINIDPSFPAAWNGLADVYYLSGQAQQAISYYKKAVSLSPTNAYEPQTNLANALRDVGLIQEAKDNYQKAIELNPLYAPAHNGYAELLFGQHDLEQAYCETLEAIRLKPTYATAYYHLGLIETGRGNKTNALKAYLLSLRYEKNSKYAQETQTLVNKLGVDSNSISFEDLKEFQAKLTNSLGSPKLEQEVTQQPESENRTTKSEKIQGQTNNLPKNSNQQISIVSVDSLIASKQWSQAYKVISALLKTHPDDPVLLNELGVALLNQKKYTDAEKAFNQAILQSDNKLASSYYNLGQIYLAKHNLPKAQSSLDKAKTLANEQKENCALIDNARAIVFKQQGNFDAAQSAYREALSQGGNNYPVIHYNLAILLEKMAKPREAAQEFQNYLQLAPNGLNARSAQARLKTIL